MIMIIGTGKRAIVIRMGTLGVTHRSSSQLFGGWNFARWTFHHIIVVIYIGFELTTTVFATGKVEKSHFISPVG
jgi:hypothetical protein